MTRTKATEMSEKIGFPEATLELLEATHRV